MSLRRAATELQLAAPKIKAGLTSKIREATHTLVIVDEHANSYHPDRKEIGTRNWQWWEIERSDAEGNKFIVVKIKAVNTSPDPLKNVGAEWAMCNRRVTPTPLSS